MQPSLISVKKLIGTLVSNGESLMTQDLSKMPVQPKPCKTCPFEGEERIDLEPESYAKYVNKIVNLESQHLCHSANNKKLCRGGRSLMLRVLCIQGLIDAPTDQAYELARLEALGEQT